MRPLWHDLLAFSAFPWHEGTLTDVRSLEIKRQMDATSMDEVSDLIADAWRADGARPLQHVKAAAGKPARADVVISLPLAAARTARPRGAAARLAPTPPPPAAPVSAPLSPAAAAFQARVHELFAQNVALGQERNAAAAAALQQAQAEQGSLASSPGTASSKDVEMA
jgi:hypothetical protein